MRCLLLGCEVLSREITDAIEGSPHTFEVAFLPSALHSLGAERMRRALQEAIDGADAERHDAVLLGYALCGNGLHGLQARRVRVVVPRAHDCIALLMGSCGRYDTYFRSHQGVYFRSAGWLENARGVEALGHLDGTGFSLAELIAEYGEDNGRYLHEQLTSYEEKYRQLTFIETGLEPDDGFERQARAEAAAKGWQFEKVRGDLGLCRDLVAGDWDPADFLVVAPGERIVASYDAGIIRAESVR